MSEQQQTVRTDDKSYFTKAELASYNAYLKTESYTEAAREVGKDRSTVWRQVEKVEEKIDEALQVKSEVIDKKIEANK